VYHTTDSNLLKIFREKFVSSNYKLILFCGRLVEHKGVDYLIESIPRIKIENIHLIIVGGGIVREKLENIVDRLGINDKVTFFGRASHEELGWLHDISDVFVCPSIIDDRGNTEGLGLVIPEAMESGLPVIASSVGGILDIVKDKVNGLLVEQKDSDAIAKAVEMILTDDEMRKRIIKNSKSTVEDFSPQKISKEYLKVFQKLSESNSV
jgi:glycosyltransferase involved in cell wall biosynthesis